MGTLLNVREAAERLRLSVGTLYRLTSQKRITFYKVGQRVLFDPADLETWVQARRVDQTEGAA